MRPLCVTLPYFVKEAKSTIVLFSYGKPVLFQFCQINFIDFNKTNILEIVFGDNRTIYELENYYYDQ